MFTRANAANVPKNEESKRGTKKSTSVNNPVISTFPILRKRKKSNKKRQANVEIVIEVKVKPMGDDLLVQISVNMIWPANINAHRIVNHSEIS